MSGVTVGSTGSGRASRHRSLPRSSMPSSGGGGARHRDAPVWSGAGHDAKYLADVCPSGMIFVRRSGGLSHCERNTARLRISKPARTCCCSRRCAWLNIEATNQPTSEGSGRQDIDAGPCHGLYPAWERGASPSASEQSARRSVPYASGTTSGTTILSRNYSCRRQPRSGRLTSMGSGCLARREW